MNRLLLICLLAVALTPGLGCLAYNDPCQPLVPDPNAVRFAASRPLLNRPDDP